MERLTLLPDPRLEGARPVLQDRLAQVAARISPDNLPSLLGPPDMAILLDAFARAGADEGTVWLLDQISQAHLVPALNTGPDAAKMLQVRQPLDRGLVSMVFSNGQPFVMNGEDVRQDVTIDRQLGVSTRAMMIVPFYFLGTIRGVISCVRLQRGEADVSEDHACFDPEALVFLRRAATTLRTAIDHRCLTAVLGIEI